MFVSRTAWHYRLHCFVFTFFNWERYGILDAFKGPKHWWEHQPKSLCAYFWSTLLLTISFPIVSLLIVALALGLGPFILAFLGVGWLYDRYRDWRPKKKQTRTGLAASYLSARKQKVCPLITIVD